LRQERGPSEDNAILAKRASFTGFRLPFAGGGTLSILARLKRWAAELVWVATPASERPDLPPGAYESPLDKLGNRAADALETGDYEKAEKLCQRLLREYPTALDGRQRLGELREAQGRFQEAAEEYAKVLAQIRANPDGTDEETVRYVTENRDRALAKARAKG